MRQFASRLWGGFRAMPLWAQVPTGILFGFFALAVVAAPFADPEGNEKIVSQGPTSTALASTTLPPTTATTLPATTTTTLVPLPAGDDTRVRSVTDGDTLVVEDGTRIRLIGVDAPEVQTGDCFSSDATNRLRALVGPGTRIRLVYDIERLDRFGRTLAYVYRLPDGLFVNLALATEGYAQQLTVPPNVAHAEDFRRALTEARNVNRGLWAACATTTTAAPVTSRATVAATSPPGTAPPTTAAPNAAGCHPAYSGACVPIASDVDCAGGRGNGPAYVSEKNFRVVGDDVYGLDDDNDGIACESR